MNDGDVKAEIIGDDEFGNNDIKSTPLTITTHRELKFNVEIGANIARKSGSLMLSTTTISLSNMIGLKVSIILTSQEIMTLYVDG
jgi:hypothetical protein